MITVKTFISSVKPAVPHGLWLKPVEGGFEAYMIDGGAEKALKLVDAPKEEKKAEDNLEAIIGSVQDEQFANTINGAKAYAKDLKNAITGTPGDAATDLTLYGLRTLIEERTKRKKDNGKGK